MIGILYGLCFMLMNHECAQMNIVYSHTPMSKMINNALAKESTQPAELQTFDAICARIDSFQGWSVHGHCAIMKAKTGLTASNASYQPGLRRLNSRTLCDTLGGWSSRAQAAPGGVLYGGEALKIAKLKHDGPHG